MPLSNLPGPWRWEDRGPRGWWRVNDSLGIEDGPHPAPPTLHAKFYDRQGKLINLYQFEEYLGDPDYKVLKQDVFVMGGEPVMVSTVWLGLDHSFIGGLFRSLPHRPLIFETMIFGGTHDLQQWRSHTEQEALEAHREAVTLLQLELDALGETQERKED